MDELELWAAAANRQRIAQQSLAMAGVHAAICGAFDGKSAKAFGDGLTKMQADMR